MNRILLVLCMLFSIGVLVGCVVPAYAEEVQPDSVSAVSPSPASQPVASSPVAQSPTAPPAAVVPNIDADPVGYASSTVDAARSGKWLAFVAFLIVGIVYVVRRWGSKLIPWLATDRGGVASALICGFLISLSATAISGTMSLNAVWVAAQQTFIAVGGFAVIKKAFWPSDARG